MARAGFYQAKIVAQNVLACIKGRDSSKLKLYKPDVGIEAAIKLTLGKVSLLCPICQTKTDCPDRLCDVLLRCKREGILCCS